ncbi:MAG: hypothetical protein RIS70_3568 [Planctomycetota bacterium]|jgi:Flp pilus assembly protein TadG
MRSFPLRKFNSRRNRRGATAVEFAIIVPVFLLLLAGIIEFGQAFRAQHALLNAARRGGRAASLTGSTNAAVTTTVRNDLVSSLGVLSTDVTVTIKLNNNASASLATAVTGDVVEVAVTLPYTKAGVNFYSNRFSSTTLRAVASYEHE